MKNIILSIAILLMGLFIGIATATEKTPQQQKTVYIWNDDPEALPTDNTEIKIDFSVNDTVYLTSKN